MQANMLETVVDQLDLKFNEEVSEFLSETFKIPMKEVVRTTIKLVAKEREIPKKEVYKIAINI